MNKETAIPEKDKLTSMVKEYVFLQEDINQFYDWIELNITSITWEGRYHKEFEDFWKNFFVPSVSLSRLQERFDYAGNILKTGPLVSWFSWLNKKFICFCFIKMNLNLRELALELKMAESDVSLILRDFYFERFPNFEDELNDVFHVSNVTSTNIFFTHTKLVEKFSFDLNIRGVWDEEIMTSLEVTLYPEWKNFVDKMKKSFYGQKFNLKKIQEKANLSKQIKFLQEVAVLMIMGGFLIIVLRFGNDYYEKHLSKEINLFQPNNFWLDQNLSYKPVTSDEEELDIELSSSEIEELEKVETIKDPFVDKEEVRFETESEVSITSIDDMPKKFELANYEQSDFEEIKKGGYRGIGVGSRKAYRVMLNSVSPREARAKLNEFLKIYGVTQVDTVKPGQKVPGGIYYNLFVPIRNVREFFAKINTVEKATIYASKSRRKTPYGKVRVFIFVKSM